MIYRNDMAIIVETIEIMIIRNQFFHIRDIGNLLKQVSGFIAKHKDNFGFKNIY